MLTNLAAARPPVQDSAKEIVHFLSINLSTTSLVTPRGQFIVSSTFICSVTPYTPYSLLYSLFHFSSLLWVAKPSCAL
jgi:hypothetical protein